MENISLSQYKKITVLMVLMLALIQTGRAQSTYLPLQYQLNQKFNADVYSTKSAFHTSLRPFLIDSVIQAKYDTIMQRGITGGHKSWIPRKIFNEHLFDVKTKEYTFYADFLPDLQIGNDFKGDNSTNLNTRGYQFGGTIGTKFSFYTSGFENSGKFANYFADLVNKYQFVPGQAYERNAAFNNFGRSKDWSYVTAIVSYSPIKQLNITLGEDKTFIGDGYRSLLLSDYAANYPLLRITANLGPVQYMAMWAYLEDTHVPKFDSFGSNRRKWAAFHYIDWNVSKRVSFGFFNAVIAQETDDAGNRHGFDANFINPLFFARSIGPSSQPDNVLAGFTAKYKVLDKTAIYGQLLIDRFAGGSFFSSNTTDNTNGVQFGIRGADLFGVSDFNYLVEYNTVRPYTYTSGQTITSYTHFSQPLGDPLGANFREYIGILNYSIGRFDLMGQLTYAKYGLDYNNVVYGKDVNAPYTATTPSPSKVGQGMAANLYYAEGTVSLLVNPKYNLRFEVGGLYRQENKASGNKQTALITFGLRSSFRNLYHDF